MSRSRLVVFAVTAFVALACAGLGIRGTSSASERSLDSPRASGVDPRLGFASNVDPRPVLRPNVVLIVADDLDHSLMPYMPHVTSLIRDQGAELTSFYVEQSSCCPSRASILSGRYAHNHGVIGNAWPKGGYERWRETMEGHDLPVWLEQAGYHNAMLGKYFNEYPFRTPNGATVQDKAERRAHVPQGWASWASPVQGNAYAQDHYKLNVDGAVDTDFRTDYLDSWLGERVLSLVRGDDGDGFAEGSRFVYYAPYSPHTPYAYPQELAGTFTDATYPRTPDFDEADVSDKFGLTPTRPRLTGSDVAMIDETFRKRIRSVQVLDQNVARLVQTLAEQGTLEETYLVFTSDNGYTMGNHRREIGKYNQFQGTVNVPFYVRGPGIMPGSSFDHVTSNVDIAPTLAEIAGAAAPADVDGVSLLPMLQGGPPPERRYVRLGRELTPANTTSSGLEEPPEAYVPTTRANRLNDFTGVTNGRYKLIRFTNLPHEELYDLSKDPYELENLLARGRESYLSMSLPGQEAVDTLRAALDRLTTCAGETCR